MPQKRTMPRVCERCGVDFLAYLYHVEHGNARYCGRLCARESPLTTEQRFWSKVDRNGPIPDYAPHLGPCWIWTGARFNARGGYGAFRGEDGKTVAAHIWAYQALVGSVPDGLERDHLCRVPPCVRPDHLDPVTHRENVIRGEAPLLLAERQAAITHCPSGHAYAGDNLAFKRSGGRRCRECERARNRRRRGEGVR